MELAYGQPLSQPLFGGWAGGAELPSAGPRPVAQNWRRRRQRRSRWFRDPLRGIVHGPRGPVDPPPYTPPQYELAVGQFHTTGRGIQWPARGALQPAGGVASSNTVVSGRGADVMTAVSEVRAHVLVEDVETAAS